eukprot:CAMPEP_0117451458 /NCGR_PEP_ID=MMETSP0759-20121206/9015_1 /TAXON_ID=63605 /ORGANISM="Percolomonas cosmopolitus, Strain WS" /LENGTH=135 /DNA_ID=CAMNT_0005244053 /DNA_START=36 /DNA_END=443 /DNA_ORIENTATION=-
MAQVFSNPALYKGGKYRAHRITLGGAVIFGACYLYFEFLYRFYYRHHISPGPLHPRQMEREFRQRGSKAHGTWTMNLGHTMNGVDHYPITWLKHLEDDDIQHVYGQEYMQEEARQYLPVHLSPLSDKDEEIVRTV